MESTSDSNTRTLTAIFPGLHESIAEQVLAIFHNDLNQAVQHLQTILESNQEDDNASSEEDEDCGESTVRLCQSGLPSKCGYCHGTERVGVWIV